MMKTPKIYDQKDSIARKFLSVAVILVCNGVVCGEVASEDLEAPTLLRSLDGRLIDTEYFSVPTVADIDGDGKRDLVVGQFMNYKTPNGGSAGTVRWYRNESQGDELPTYGSGVNLKSNKGLLYAANW